MPLISLGVVHDKRWLRSRTGGVLFGSKNVRHDPRVVSKPLRIWFWSLFRELPMNTGKSRAIEWCRAQPLEKKFSNNMTQNLTFNKKKIKT
jgi:hypothetical protein